MEKIFVNRILEDSGTTHGIAVVNSTIIKNMTAIFDRDQITKIMSLIKNKPSEDFYFFTKFCQFVIFSQYQRGLGITMKFMDFQDNDNAALDEYLSLTEKKWLQSDRERIMKIFYEIKNAPTATATLVVENPL